MSISLRLAVTAAICAAANFSQTAFASDPPSFAPELTISTVTPAVTTVMGDFDGDGIPDVAVMGGIVDSNGNYTGGSVEIHFGDGAHGFRSATATIALNLPGSSYQALAAADLSASGRSQLIIAGTNIVVVYDWKGGVTFNQTHVIDLSATGITGTYLAVGDLTKAGSRDIVVSDHYDFINGSLGLAWIPNDGTGNFGTPTIIPAACVTRPMLVDINGDGLVDIVLDDPDPQYTFIGTGLKQGATVGVVLNEGGGMFAQEIFWGNTDLHAMTNSAGRFQSLTTVGVAVADVDGDGKTDLISACFLYGGAPDFKYTYYLSVNLGNGDGTFQDGIAFPATNGITALGVGDINGDGRVDVVTVDDEFVDQNFPGFMVTEFSRTGASLAVARQTDIPALRVNNSALSYNSIALGYKSAGGAFVTFNNDPKIDVILGSGQNIYGANNSVHHQFIVFQNTTGTTLPATSLVVVGKPTNGAPLVVFVSQPSTAPGVAVRIQYTTTTNIESSWKDLPGGGQLTSNGAGVYSFGTTGTTAYPGGAGIYFRAITSAPGLTDSIAPNIYGPYNLSQAQFTINVRETSTSDPSGTLHVVHIGDNLNFTFIWTNIGNAIARDVIVKAYVPTYLDANTDLHVQFARSNLTFNQYGNYVSQSAPDAGDAYVWWNVSDLPAGSSQAVTLTAQVGTFVRLQEAIGVLDNYEVYSGSNQPPTAATGQSSGAPPESSTVLGPFSMTITPDVTTVAPGGFINYTITVQNQASYTITNVVIADPVPEFTSFSSATFLNTKGAAIASPAFTVKVAGNPKPVAVSNPLRLIGLYPLSSQPAQVQTFLAANPEIVSPPDHADQVVFYVGNIAKGGSATVRLKVQAQYIEAQDVTDQKIKNFNYLASFTGLSGGIVVSNTSGEIDTPDQGTVKSAPNLSLFKSVSSESLKPGDVLAVVLVARNSGSSAANDVFIQDSLPTGPYSAGLPVLITTNFTKPQAVTISTLNSAAEIITGGASSTTSKASYFVTLDPGGLITVHALHLEPGATVGITYFMQVPTAAPVPENLFCGGCFVGAGNGSQSTVGIGNQTLLESVPPGNPASYTVNVSGYVQLSTSPNPIPAVPNPKITTNPTLTTNLLDKLFAKNPNASLVIYTNIGKNKNVPEAFPGVQRYLLDYQNKGTNTAPDVHLQFTTPPNTEFYRASFTSAGKVTSATKTQSIGQPGKLQTGAVTFNIGSLAAGSAGSCLVEVILLPGAVSQSTSQVIPAAPLIYSGNPPKDIPRKLDDSYTNSGGGVVYDGLNVPKVGFVKVEPRYVHPGDSFDIQIASFCTSALDGVQVGADVTMHAPAGTQITGFSNDAGDYTGTSIDQQTEMNPHSADGFVVHLVATGPAGTTITNNSIVATVPWRGTITLPPTTIEIVDSQQLIPNTTATTIVGAQFMALGEMAVVPLGQGQFTSGGQALVCGPQTGFGTLKLVNSFSTKSGNMVVYGPTTGIQLTGLPVLGNTDTKTILANIAKVVGKQGGNLFNGPEDNLIGPDGQSIIDNDTGGVQTTLTALLSAGGRSVVASGTGALPAVANTGPVILGAGHALASGGGNVLTSGGGVISNDGGSLVGPSGGTLISQDGAGLISQDGAGVVATDGAGLVGHDGASIISSPASGAQVVTQGGSLVGSSGGTFK